MNRVLARTFAVRAQKSKVTHVILSDGVENVGAKGEHLAVKKGSNIKVRRTERAPATTR